ncbi:MAG: hypothetical protein CMJ59_13780 [Planctomycetaceae bacterium]|nr:hypothetical protein [Planctomycetaceae bacterium]
MNRLYRVKAISYSPYGRSDRWFLLTLVALNYFTIYLHRNLLNYVQIPLQEGLGLTDIQIGWLRPAWLMPYCLAQLGVGYLSDRFRRRTVILGSLAASSCCLAAMGLSRGFGDMLLGRVLLGIGQSCAVPAMASIIADCFTDRNRSRAFGIYLFSYNCALVVAGKYGGRLADTDVWHVPVGAAVLDVAGWRMAHFVFGAVGMGVWLILLLVLREPARTDQAQEMQAGPNEMGVWRSVGCVLAVPSFRLFAVTFALGGMVVSMIQFWLPRYYYEVFHLTRDWDLEDAGSFATLWIQIGTVSGLFVGGWLADWWSARTVHGRVAVQIIGWLVVAPSILVIGTSHAIPLLAVAMLAAGLGVGLYQSNTWTATFEVVDPATRATAVGLLNLGSGVLVHSWFDPVIGWLNETILVSRSSNSLGMLLACMSVPATIAAALLAFAMVVTLPRDFQGANRPPDGE